MKKRFFKCLLLTALIGLAFLVWLPLWFVVSGALLPLDELNDTLAPALGLSQSAQHATWRMLPSWPSLQPMTELLLDTPQFFVMFWNTCGQVVLQIIGQVCIATPAAWALSRLRFRGRGVLMVLYVTLMLMPFQVTMVPNFLILDALGLRDTPWAIIFPGAFSAFAVFIIAKGFDAVPRSLLEAAVMDGANHWQIFWHVGLPLGLPGILAALVLGFLEAWSAIEQPMILLQDKSQWPLSLYLSEITVQNLGVSLAASLVMLAPSVVIFQFGQAYLELGIHTSGLKE